MKRSARGALHRLAAGHRAGEGDEGDARVGDHLRDLVVIMCRYWKTPSGRPAALNASA